MREYEKKEVIKIEKTLKAIICDMCKKDISEVDSEYYYEVTTSHSLWGNDSVDSIQHSDFCSYECLKKDMDEYFADAKESSTYEIEKERK